jgi:penicillin-binding protein 1A
MAAERKGGTPRREPGFDIRGNDIDLRLRRSDRIGSDEARDARSGSQDVKPERRREPHFAPLLHAARPDGETELNPPPQEESRAMPRSRQNDTRERGGRRRRRRSLLGGLVYWSFVSCLWGAIGLVGLFAYHAAQLPPIDQLRVPRRPPNIAIHAVDGSLLANRGETGGRTVQLAELPAYLPKAFVAIEDRRFYSHWGIDPLGIGRALFRNASGRGMTQGGSTLTQQLAKNLFLTQERTISRKFQEAILALWLERNYSKDEILALYLNRVYFGSGAYGVEAAAQRYFGKPARAVTLAEAAMLAGLVQAPSRLAPNRNPDAAAARAELVVAAMLREGMISDEAAKVALMSPGKATRRAQGGSINYAADHVMDVLDDYVGDISGDVIVLTTIDRRLQAAAEAALVQALKRDGARLDVEQGAIVALAPNGAVRVLVGGRDYSESQFNRAVNAKRQPGSAFKPFVYLTALERGLAPESRRLDAPITIKGWSPENYSRQFMGEVPLSFALSRSLNTVPVRLLMEYGAKSVVRTAQRLGFSSPLKATPSLALGSSEVTPLELATAYAAFANGGVGVIPHVISEVKSTSGRVLYRRKSSNLGRVVAPREGAMMTAMLRETLSAGTGRKAELPGIDAAGKTGTSQEFRDAWFVGYTAHLVAAVWLGNDDSSPTKKVAGGNLPSEIWRSFMIAAHQGLPGLPLPGGGTAEHGPVTANAPGDPVSVRPPPTRAPQPAAPPRPPANVGDNAWEKPREPGLLERLFRGG